jgi:hypothetical protein
MRRVPAVELCRELGIVAGDWVESPSWSRARRIVSIGEMEVVYSTVRGHMDVTRTFPSDARKVEGGR